MAWAMAEVGADDGRDGSDGSNGPTGGTSPDDGTGAGHEASSGGGIQELGTSLIYNARLPLQSTGTAGRARGTARTEDSAGSGTADGATVCANRGDRPVRRAALQACAALHASVAADSNDDRDDDDDDIREDDEDEDSRASQEEGLARHIDYSNDDGNDEADFDESEDEDEDESDIDSMIDQDDLEDIEEALQAQLDGYDSEISNDGATGDFDVQRQDLPFWAEFMRESGQEGTYYSTGRA